MGDALWALGGFVVGVPVGAVLGAIVRYVVSLRWPVVRPPRDPPPIDIED